MTKCLKKILKNLNGKTYKILRNKNDEIPKLT